MVKNDVTEARKLFYVFKNILFNLATGKIWLTPDLTDSHLTGTVLYATPNFY